MESGGKSLKFFRGRGRKYSLYRPYFFSKSTKVKDCRSFVKKHLNHREKQLRRPTVSGEADEFTANRRKQLSYLETPTNVTASEGILQSNQNEIPGWKLYFPKDSYDVKTPTIKMIGAVKNHIAKNRLVYDLVSVHTNGFFSLDAEIVGKDNELKRIWPDLFQDMLNRPVQTLSIFGVSMYSLLYVVALDASISLNKCNTNLYTYTPRFLSAKKVYVRPTNFTQASSMSDISNTIADKLISVRGYLMSASSTEATTNWICYRCFHCNQKQSLKQSGDNSLKMFRCLNASCHAKRGFIITRNSAYTRIHPRQTIRLEENTFLKNGSGEKLNLAIELNHDLAASTKPGQNLIVTGFLKLRSLAASETNNMKCQFGNNRRFDLEQMYLKAVSVIDSTFMPFDFTDHDSNFLQAISNEKICLKLLADSFAADICGEERSKLCLLFSLVGGVGSKVNVLLVGDPGTGKSHLLQMGAQLAEKGTLITSKQGSVLPHISNINDGSNPNLVNFGALISSIGGHLICDDIDTAKQQDFLFQAMQSQSLSISLPGIFFNQSIKSSVIASANADSGYYNNSKQLSENVKISQAFITQFHMAFILLDKPNKESDMLYAKHVQHLHDGNKNIKSVSARDDIKPGSSLSVFRNPAEKNIHAFANPSVSNFQRPQLSGAKHIQRELLSSCILGKYLVFCRQQNKPLLSDAAAKEIKHFYLQSHNFRTLNIQSGFLMGIICLSQAHARIIHSTEVNKIHVDEVTCTVRDCIQSLDIGDQINKDHGDAKTTKSKNMKKFLKVLQLRASALSRRTFDLDELKEVAHMVGINSDLLDFIDIANCKGFLLKRAFNLYEVTELNS